MCTIMWILIVLFVLTSSIQGEEVKQRIGAFKRLTTSLDEVKGNVTQLNADMILVHTGQYDLESENKALKDRVKVLEEQTQGDRGNIDTLDTETSELKTQLTALRVETEELRSANNALQNRVIALEEQTQGDRGNIETLDTETTKLKTDLASLNSETQGLQAENTAVQDRVTAVEKQAEDDRNDIGVLRNDVDKLETDLGSLETDTDGIKTKLSKSLCQSGVVEFTNDWLYYRSWLWPMEHTVSMKSFDRTPVISMGQMHFDATTDTNTRIDCYHDTVTYSSFKVTCNTWAGSKVYDIKLSWMAC